MAAPSDPSKVQPVDTLASTTTTADVAASSDSSKVQPADTLASTAEEDELMDDLILHFYDLSIQKPYICYDFVKQRIVE